MEPVMQSILNSVNMLYVLVALWGLSQVFSSVAYNIPEGWPGDIAGEEMIASIQRFCGRDENGTVIHEPEDDFCEMPRYTTYIHMKAADLRESVPTLVPSSSTPPSFLTGRRQALNLDDSDLEIGVGEGDGVYMNHAPTRNRPLSPLWSLSDSP